MSYGHADKVARLVSGTPAAEPVIDPALYYREDVRPALAERDIAALFQVLRDDVGLTQRTIAELVGMSQSEVSEILKGRQVIAYDVLVRICEGAGVPRELMGLSYGTTVAYPGQSTVAKLPAEVIAEMIRRHMLALSTMAAIGELLGKLPHPPPVQLPDQLSRVHVTKVRDLTRRAYGSDPEVSSAAAAWASELLDVSGSDALRQALRVAVAELHIEAGWGAFDAGLYARAMSHYSHALALANEAGDAYCQALALNFGGLATVEHGDPNEGLKLLQVGSIKALDIPKEVEPRLVVVGANGRSAVQACAGADSATALANLDEPEQANTALARSRELWQPTPADPGGELDRPAAILELDRGRLDRAEQFAAASVRRWEGSNKRGYTHSCVVLATIYVRAGESKGLQLAHSAISATDKISSVRVRKRLIPLANDLDARRGSDAKQLAHLARQVAATRI